MELLKILIPIITFFLGWVLNIILNRYMNKVKIHQESATTLWKLSRAWYEQLQEIRNNFDKYVETDLLEKKVIEYLNNRIILPDFIFHLEIIKSNKKFSDLYHKCNSFLDQLTFINDDGRSMCCRLQLEKPDFIKLLDNLDLTLQDIARTSGKIAAEIY